MPCTLQYFQTQQTKDDISPTTIPRPFTNMQLPSAELHPFDLPQQCVPQPVAPESRTLLDLDYIDEDHAGPAGSKPFTTPISRVGVAAPGNAWRCRTIPLRATQPGCQNWD